MKPTCQQILDLPRGERYKQGDPVLVPDPDHPTRPKYAVFDRYVTKSGDDRKVLVTVPGEQKPAWESFIVPNMENWFREL